MSAPGETPPCDPNVPPPPPAPRRVLPTEVVPADRALARQSVVAWQESYDAQQAPPPPPLASLAPSPRPLPAVPDFSKAAFPPAPRVKLPKPLVRLGILCLLVATAMAGIALGTMVGAIGFLVSADAVAKEIVQSAAARSAAPPAVGVKEVREPTTGMNAGDRRIVLDALAYLEAFSPRRKEQLDAMLARTGLSIFPPEQVRRTRQGYQAAVAEHGELFSSRPNDQGPFFFVTRTGRLEVYDERAVFYPGDNSGTVRTFAGGPPGSQGLTPVQVSDVIAQAQAACNNRLGAAQGGALTALLLQPKQDLVPPHRAKQAVRSVTLQGGTAVVNFYSGTVRLGPQGQIVPSGVSAPPRLNRAAFAGVMLLSVAMLAQAIYLLATGIATLRSASRSRRAIASAARATLLMLLTMGGLSIWMLTDLRDRLDALQGSLQAGPVAQVFWAHWTPWVVGVTAFLCLLPALLLLAARSARRV